MRKGTHFFAYNPERHHPWTRCSTVEVASSPILADAIVFGITTFERIAEY